MCSDHGSDQCHPFASSSCLRSIPRRVRRVIERPGISRYYLSLHSNQVSVIWITAERDVRHLPGR